MSFGYLKMSLANWSLNSARNTEQKIVLPKGLVNYSTNDLDRERVTFSDTAQTLNSRRGLRLNAFCKESQTCGSNTAMT